MLVNSLSNDSAELSKCGAIAMSFLKKGQDQFGDDFRNKGGVKEGEMKVHDGSLRSFSCRRILHVTIGEWSGRGSRMVCITVR